MNETEKRIQCNGAGWKTYGAHRSGLKGEKGSALVQLGGRNMKRGLKKKKTRVENKNKRHVTKTLWLKVLL